MTEAKVGKAKSSEVEAKRGQVALKGFFSICREWECSQDEMIQLLGGISRRTVIKYQKLPRIRLSRDTLERISYIMGIYKSLMLMYPAPERANRRIRKKTSEVPFCGSSALDFMVRGSMKHLMEARRYFDSKRSGE